MSYSLLPPASYIVKHLSPQSPPCNYLELLDSAFGMVEDGDKLFAKFMSTFQNAGEKPSQFLHRLQKVLGTAIKRGSVSVTERHWYLLKQFCRGCWNNAIITELQLEQKRKNPPAFSDLLLLLRTEEDKQAIKAVRMNTWALPSTLPDPQGVWFQTSTLLVLRYLLRSVIKWRN